MHMYKTMGLSVLDAETDVDSAATMQWKRK